MSPIHLLKIEWLKLKHYSTFQVLIILYTILLPLTYLVGNAFPPEGQSALGLAGMYEFPNIYKYLGFEGSWFNFFFASIIGVILITNEFSFKTLRQNVITGMTRKDLFVGKLMAGLVIAAVFTLVYVVSILIYGLINMEWDYFNMDKILSNADYIPRYFLQSFGYIVMGMFFGALFKRLGLSLILFLIYAGPLELYLRWGIHQRIAASLAEQEFFMHKSMHFYPNNVLDDLLPVPFPDFFKGMANEAPDTDITIFLSPLEACGGAVFFSALFLFFVYRRFQKMDI